MDGGHQFLNYALTEGEQDSTIDDYKMDGFPADEEEYNVHLGRSLQRPSARPRRRRRLRRARTCPTLSVR